MNKDESFSKITVGKDTWRELFFKSIIYYYNFTSLANLALFALRGVHNSCLLSINIL